MKPLHIRLEEARGDAKREERKLWFPFVFVGVIIGLIGEKLVSSPAMFLLEAPPGEVISSLACELMAANVGSRRGRRGDLWCPGKSRFFLSIFGVDVVLSFLVFLAHCADNWSSFIVDLHLNGIPEFLG